MKDNKKHYFLKLGDRCWFRTEGGDLKVGILMLAPISELEDEYVIKLEEDGRNVIATGKELTPVNPPSEASETLGQDKEKEKIKGSESISKQRKGGNEVAQIRKGKMHGQSPVFGGKNPNLSQKLKMAFGNISIKRAGKAQGYEAPSRNAMEQLRKLHTWLQISVEQDDPAVAKLLQRFWIGAFGENEAFVPQDERWIQLGFQRDTPHSDFRGGGLLALKCLVYFSENHQQKMKYLFASSNLQTSGTKGMFFPFAVSGINLTVAVCDILGLTSPFGLFPEPRSYWEAFEDENTFFELYSIGLYVMDRIREESGCGVMDFVAVLRWTKQELENLLEHAPKSLNELIELSVAVPGTRAQMELQRSAEVEAIQAQYEDGLVVEERNILVTQITVNAKVEMRQIVEGQPSEPWLELNASHEKGEQNLIFEFEPLPNALGLRLPTNTLKMEIGVGRTANFEGSLLFDKASRFEAKIDSPSFQQGILGFTLNFKVYEPYELGTENCMNNGFNRKIVQRSNSFDEKKPGALTDISLDENEDGNTMAQTNTSGCEEKANEKYNDEDTSKSPETPKMTVARTVNESAENKHESREKSISLEIKSSEIILEGGFDVNIPLQLLFIGHPKGQINKKEFPGMWQSLPEETESYKSIQWPKEKDKVDPQQMIELIESFGICYVTKRKVKGVPLLYFSSKVKWSGNFLLIEVTLQQTSCGVCVKSKDKSISPYVFLVFRTAMRGAKADPIGSLTQEVICIGDMNWEKPDSIEI